MSWIASLLAAVEAAWLFTRGTQSVRIVRAALDSGVMHLLVQGPGDAVDRRQFADVVACVNYQSDLERRLVAEGYALERFMSDRRSGRSADWRLARDRRRPALVFL